MSAATRKIYDAVARRADGQCECGCSRFLCGDGELDHALSRRVPQTIQNCWLLKRECHDNFTNNRPDGAARLVAFIAHCRKHGYAGELARAESRLVFVKVRAELAAPRVVTP